jgi:hypothetical protein
MGHYQDNRGSSIFSYRSRFNGSDHSAFPHAGGMPIGLTGATNIDNKISAFRNTPILKDTTPNIHHGPAHTISNTRSRQLCIDGMHKDVGGLEPIRIRFMCSCVPRARRKSDWRRISPTSSPTLRGRGDKTCGRYRIRIRM